MQRRCLLLLPLHTTFIETCCVADKLVWTRSKPRSMLHDLTLPKEFGTDAAEIIGEGFLSGFGEDCTFIVRAVVTVVDARSRFQWMRPSLL